LAVLTPSGRLAAVRTLRIALCASAFALAVLAFPRLAMANPCSAGKSYVRHEVKTGESLSTIAAKYGTGYKAIQKMNPRAAGGVIQPGQRLDICAASDAVDDRGGADKATKTASPSKGTKTTAASQGKGASAVSSGAGCGGGGRLRAHEVEKGETLSEIADRYDVTMDALLSRNKRLREAPNSLQVGQTLQVCTQAKKTKADKACNYETPVFEHEVVPGEILSSIANRYGVRRRDLMRLNPRLRDRPDLIRPGDTVRVCPDIAPRTRAKIIHTVQSGETFGGIAEKYGLTPRELIGYQQGKIANSNDLKAGQSLVVWKEGGIAPGFGGIEDEKGGGVLVAGIQMPPGRHYFLKTPSLAYGSEKAVTVLQRAVDRYKTKFPKGPKVHIGDLSKKGGGKSATATGTTSTSATCSRASSRTRPASTPRTSRTWTPLARGRSSRRSLTPTRSATCSSTTASRGCSTSKPRRTA
jgi:LysM repeat protein